MFDNQFNIALKYTEQNFPPVFIYALETSIQLTLTELNENVREMYLEAYRQPQSAEYIYRHMAIRLYQTFHSYLPACTESDFYELEIGSSGIIRAYMARSCDLYFTLERKLSRFLTMSLSAYSVPPDEQKESPRAYSNARYSRSFRAGHAGTVPKPRDALFLLPRQFITSPSSQQSIGADQKSGQTPSVSARFPYPSGCACKVPFLQIRIKFAGIPYGRTSLSVRQNACPKREKSSANSVLPLGGQSRPPLRTFRKVFHVCVRGDAHIAPLGSYEFALDFRKNG